MQILNKKAPFEYRILETLEAGIVLFGSEVKSVRAGKVDLAESFARVQNNELYLKNAYIYHFLGQKFDYDPRRDRKLLVHRKQIQELIGKTSRPATTLVPLSIYTTRNLIKVKLGLAQTKKKFDKRAAIKRKDEQRRIEQELKN